MKKIAFILATLVCANLFAQQQPDYDSYIAQYSNLAMHEQIRTGVPACITLAQGLLESSAGKGELVLRSNNHFGIKCKNYWAGEKVYHDDDAKGECFRAYSTAEDSYRDHSDFLKNNGRYAFLFSIDPNDYKGWAAGLKKAGYATNPQYTASLIRVIEENNLNQYTTLALNMPKAGSDIASHTSTVTATAIATIASPDSKTEIIQSPAENSNLRSTAANTRIANFPEGTFSINNCNVVWAKAGSSMLALASSHKLTVSELLAFNDMDRKDILEEDQLVFLERKQKKGGRQTHEVLEGETIWSISQTEGVRLAQLLEWNHLKPEAKLTPGSTVYLQQAAPSK